MDKVTVVTVTYNCASILEKTIKSVICQSYPFLEYIVIDGGSNDGTVEVIKKFEDKITYWQSEPDRGIYDAMNKGIRKSQGKWINFMNAGDYFCHDKVLWEIFKEPYSEKTGFIYGKEKSIQNKGIKENGRTVSFMEQKTKYRNMGINHQAIFTRVDLARKFPFDLSFKLCADYNMIMSIWKSGFKGVYVDVYVAVTEQRYGLSAKNRNAQRMEEARVCGCDKDISFLSFYYYKMFRAWIKNISAKLKFK